MVQKQLDQSIVNEIFDSVNTIFFNKYIEIVKDSLVEFKKLYSSIVDEISKEIVGYDMKITENVISKKERAVRRIKLRMLNTFESRVIKDDESINEEPVKTKGKKLSEYNKNLIAMKQIFNGHLELKPKASFEELYGYKDYMDFKNKLIKEVDTWAKDNSVYITEYKYINDYTKTKIISYMKKDISLYFFRYLYKNYPDCEKKMFATSFNKTLFVPKSLSEVSYDHTSKKKHELSNAPGIYTNVYKVENIEFVSQVDIRNIPEDIKKDALTKLINITDMEVVKFFLSIAPQTFFINYKVECMLDDIVRYVFKIEKPSSWYYNSVRNSIFKLAHWSATIIDDNGNQVMYRILSDGDVIPLPNNGGQKVIVTFAEKFVKDMLKKGPISIYDDIVSNYKSNMAKALIISLQTKRYEIAQTPMVGQYVIHGAKDWTVPLGYYSFFSRALILSKNKSRNLKELEIALTEIKNSDIIIEEFERNNDVFYITFYPITSQEQLELSSFMQGYYNLMDELGLIIPKNNELLDS